jgi:hypothetical protein
MFFVQGGKMKKEFLEDELDALRCQLAAVRKKYEELALRASADRELISQIRQNLVQQIDLNGWIGQYYELPELYRKYATWCMDQGDVEAARKANATDIDDLTTSYQEHRCLRGFEDWKQLYD